MDLRDGRLLVDDALWLSWSWISAGVHTVRSDVPGPGRGLGPGKFTSGLASHGEVTVGRSLRGAALSLSSISLALRERPCRVTYAPSDTQAPRVY